MNINLNMFPKKPKKKFITDSLWLNGICWSFYVLKFMICILFYNIY